MLYGVQFPMSDEALDKEFLIPLGKSKIERTGIITLLKFIFEKKNAIYFSLYNLL